MPMQLRQLVPPFAATCVLLCLGVADLSGQPRLPGPAQPAGPQAADYELLAEVFAPSGTPSVKNKAWVKVDTGPANAPSGLTGWLIEDGAKEITVLDRDGDLHKLRKPGPDERRPALKVDKDGTMPYTRYREADRSVAWKAQPEDFAAIVKKFLADGIPVHKEVEGFRDMTGGRFSLQAHVIDAARFAHFVYQHGEAEQASQVYAHAAKACKKYTDSYGGGFEKTGRLHEFVADRSASRLRNGAIYSAHGGTARAELKKIWERVAAIPHQQYRDEARETAKHYQSLLDEDGRWVEPDAKALAAMTPAQKAGYWLYHLRDLAVGQWSDPGTCRVLDELGFGNLEGEKAKPNAAVELKKLGMAAVPQLIAHLDDARPTRCKGHWRSYWPDGHYLLRYGDCCQQIFESITGHSISSATYPIQDGKGKECKAKAEGWWQEYQKKGEKQVLIEGTSAGDRDSPELAKRLAAKYPDAALAPIIQGAGASKDGWTRASLVSTANQLKDQKVVAFLKDELDGPFLDSRVRAGAALATRGDPAGIKGLLHEWKQLLAKNVDPRDHSWAIDELVHATTRTGDPAVLRVLGEEEMRHPLRTRSAVIKELAQADKDLRGKPLTEEYKAAIEDLLVRAMADLEEENSASSRAGKSLRNPMLGDLAAEALVRRWGQPKLFDITGPVQVRQRQRVEVKNVWLRKRGKEPVPVPPLRKVTAATDAKMQPLVRAVLDAKSPAEREQALESIEHVGLPALPAVRKMLSGLAADHPARDATQSLAARLALIVSEVCFAADSVKPTDAMSRKLDALKGRPITEKAFMELLRGTAAALPEGVRGIKIMMERMGDESGVYLAVTLIADRPAREGLSPQLSFGSRIQIGEKSLGGGIGGLAGLGAKKPGLDKIDWTKFVNHLRVALQARPDEKPPRCSTWILRRWACRPFSGLTRRKGLLRCGASSSFSARIQKPFRTVQRFSKTWKR
jgi:hypothetical protein